MKENKEKETRAKEKAAAKNTYVYVVSTEAAKVVDEAPDVETLQKRLMKKSYDGDCVAVRLSLKDRLTSLETDELKGEKLLNTALFAALGVGGCSVMEFLENLERAGRLELLDIVLSKEQTRKASN